MSTAVIIAEYNPFHNGHRFHIEETRRLCKADNIAIVMSGNFVQRGEPALFNKYIRAEHAIRCGADIVIELPCIYALSSAAYFAEGAIRVASQIKNVEYLSFGSECGDVEKLLDLSVLTDSDDYSKILRNELNKGLSYAIASQKARQSLSDDIALQPNDTLGVEYVKSLNKFAPNIKPLAIKRLGDYHSQIINKNLLLDDENRGGYASASAIRANLNNLDLLNLHVPPCVYESLISPEFTNFDRLYSIIAMQLLNGFDDAYEDNEGLINRVIKAISAGGNYENLINFTHTKRYTKSRIKRFLLHIALKQNPQLLNCSIDYTRVLAVNSNKKYLLSDVKNIVPNSELYLNDMYADRIYEIITASKRMPDSPIFV